MGFLQVGIIVAHGRQAAISIDKYFGYDGKLFDKERKVVEVSYDEEKYLKTIQKKKSHFSNVEERIKSLCLEVNLGLTKEDAIEESRRCLHCDRGEPVIKTKEETKSIKIEEML
jgi:NADH-quinone oxidoreductase subunit F